MMQYIKKNKINGKQAKQIFPEIIKDKKTVDQIISDLGLKQIVDPTPLKNILNKLIKDNAEIVQQYKSRPERVEKFLVGMVMKETRGQANPQLVKTIMDELLASYK
jgi:aspartyl-tRNA(Asn)/glutamyl-tRNA(Gln) amidotransferase subunit B